ncbi:MAG: glucosamine-6-phosphate deaminase [Candidatus Buchananbacteria bacterium RIFCSPLOWO2_01_FULL_40_23b]|uniref:Glucosamine-6-phosphate deaminase n=1 Tax=Candidatus Buchananbacteria bacterium RIFCSPLOWO2_01_FULL_40_23b TaxID=1797544 RepID=A0A1G1YTB0_9BACT|nr:MAG: glucosamine-6-phosphate deaminase [Candidatus Buchananbacteria bacterium RIFCSPLOWO2_01_FULL_40_23b]
MRFIITKNYQELSQKAADLVIKQIKQKPNSVLGLATGSTPLGLYQNLVKVYKQGSIDFKKITTFNLDEYYGLTPTDKQSYHYFMWHNLFSKININPKNIFIPDGLIKKNQLKIYCQNYEREIKKHGGIDLQILGLGQNGHLGFNEPGFNFNSKTRLVNLTKTTISANSRFFNNKKIMPRQAVTMGLKTITQAKKIILLASGENKAKVIALAVKGQVTAKVPASILQKHKNTTFILDQKAVSLL